MLQDHINSLRASVSQYSTDAQVTRKVWPDLSKPVHGGVPSAAVCQHLGQRSNKLHQAHTLFRHFP